MDKAPVTESGEGQLKKQFQKLSLDTKSDDAADLYKHITNLSPTTQANLGVLLRSISNGEALIDTDQEGRAQIEYKQAKKIYWDGSNANIIAKPRSDEDVQLKVDACLELIGYLKSEKPPSGVLLDSTQVSLSQRKEYREGFEFEKTKKVLGSGNSAGDIVVVKDRKTGLEHALKTMMISYFHKEEIRCWVDMANTGYVPSLYLFKIEGQKVLIHMEILKNAKTLRSIIDEYMEIFYKDEVGMSLVKPFSLMVLDGALEAVSALHSKGWVHNDLHGGNVLVQKSQNDTLGVKILDFGLANLLEDSRGLNLRGFQADICEVMRLFSAVYTGLEFDNVLDIKNNWQPALSKVMEWTEMSRDDRRELFCLIDAAMKIVHPLQLKEYREQVRSSWNNATGDELSQKRIMKKVAALLFPEDFQPLHPSSTNHCETDGQSGRHARNFDVADSSVVHDETEAWSDGESDIDLQLDVKAQQISDDYLDFIRLTLGISPH